MVFRVGGGMYANETAAGLDVTFKFCFLVLIQQDICRIGSIEEYDSSVPGQTVFRKVPGVCGSVYLNGIIRCETPVAS